MVDEHSVHFGSECRSDETLHFQNIAVVKHYKVEVLY
jgi:hypothetical protein